MVWLGKQLQVKPVLAYNNVLNQLMFLINVTPLNFLHS